jgi:hypothetical protein
VKLYPSLSKDGILMMMCIVLNKGFKKIPIVLRRGGGGWTRPEYFLDGWGPLRGWEICLKFEKHKKKLMLV